MKTPKTIKVQNRQPYRKLIDKTLGLINGIIYLAVKLCVSLRLVYIFCTYGLIEYVLGILWQQIQIVPIVIYHEVSILDIMYPNGHDTRIYRTICIISTFNKIISGKIEA